MIQPRNKKGPRTWFIISIRTGTVTIREYFLDDIDYSELRISTCIWKIDTGVSAPKSCTARPDLLGIRQPATISTSRWTNECIGIDDLGKRARGG